MPVSSIVSLVCAALSMVLGIIRSLAPFVSGQPTQVSDVVLPGALLMLGAVWLSIAGQRAGTGSRDQQLQDRGLVRAGKPDPKLYRIYTGRWHESPFGFIGGQDRLCLGKTDLIVEGHTEVPFLEWVWHYMNQSIAWAVLTISLSLLYLPLVFLAAGLDAIRRRVTPPSRWLVGRHLVQEVYGQGSQIVLELRGAMRIRWETRSGEDTEEIARHLRNMDATAPVVAPASVAAATGSQGATLPREGASAPSPAPAPSSREVAANRTQSGTEASVNADRYVHLLVQQMINDGTASMHLSAAKGLPAIRGASGTPDFIKVVNQYKVMSGLFPQFYAQPVEGNFQLRCAGRQGEAVLAVVTTEFIDKPAGGEVKLRVLVKPVT